MQADTTDAQPDEPTTELLAETPWTTWWSEGWRNKLKSGGVLIGLTAAYLFAYLPTFLVFGNELPAWLALLVVILPIAVAGVLSDLLRSCLAGLSLLKRSLIVVVPRNCRRLRRWPGVRLNGRRILPCLIVVVAVLLTACSSTDHETLPNSDLVLRNGPTMVGWILVYVGAVAGTLFLGLFAVVALAGVGGESVEAGAAKKYWQAVGWALAVPLVLGLVGLAGWGLAAITVLDYQSTVVTLSGQQRELQVERDRPIGSDSVLVWSYDELASVDFDYVPGAGGGDEYIPPRGDVYLHATGRERVLVFDGSPCAARELAESVKSRTGAPLAVDSGGRDISSVGAFFTQLRCGIDDPIRATSWSDYPAEIWRVLDLPFLWRWPWALPIVAAQIALIVGALTVVRRLRNGPPRRRFIMVALCIAAGSCIVVAHVFATKSYGNWPGALALFALLSGKFVAKRLFAGDASTDLSESRQPGSPTTG